MQTNLEKLMAKNDEAAEYYHSLHTSVRAAVDEHAMEIKTQEDLIEAANRSMSGLLKEYGGIYDDSSQYPKEGA